MKLADCRTRFPVSQPCDRKQGYDSSRARNGVPRGTMDEVSSHVRLDLSFFTVRPRQRLFRLVFVSHDGRALVPIPKRSASSWVISIPRFASASILERLRSR